MNKLPAGLQPTDKNIEIFADPFNFGRCFFVREGKTMPFGSLPHDILMKLTDELLDDPRAMAGLKVVMGLTEGTAMLEHYNFCNRGALDCTADISISGCKTREYVACGRKGKCAGEGIVCSPVIIDGEHISYRELECLRLIGIGLTYKRIMIEMGFRSVTAVNSLTDRLRDKLHCANNMEVALRVKELGIA